MSQENLRIMETQKIEKILKALANKRRIEIIKFLNKKGVATVSSIAREIKLSFRSTSKHLAILAAADILEKNQQGLNVFCNINQSNKSIRKILSLLDL